MKSSPPERIPKPARVTGLAHLFAAQSYSLSGFRRLWRETAFRHEIILFIAALAWCCFLAVPVVEYAVLTGLFFLLVSVEALNTAIECIVDQVSPDWAEFAKDAKDLGSLAVMGVLLAIGLFLAVITANQLFGFDVAQNGQRFRQRHDMCLFDGRVRFRHSHHINAIKGSYAHPVG
jgi:diacylglycerol kinase (ATP)